MNKRLDFIISNLSGGGAQRVMVLLVNYLIEKDFDIRIIKLYESNDSYKLHPKIDTITLVPKSRTNQKINALVGLCQLYKTKENRPDFIISFITLTNLISIINAKIFGIKIIICEHNSHLQAQRPKFLTKLTRNIFYRFSNLLTVLTEFDLDFYKKRKVNVMVMPNPCTFKPITNNTHTRKKTILAVGSLDRYHHKGFDNLIKLIEPVLLKNPEWNLKIIGGGEEGSGHLKYLSSKTKVADRIEFTGFIDNVNDYMRHSSIFVLSSRFEGLPMVLLEAMSQGMACIAYDCKTGPSDIIENRVNGILIEDQNQLMMIEQLNDLLSNESLRLKLSSNAIQSLNSFSIENISQSWEKLFKTL